MFCEKNTPNFFLGHILKKNLCFWLELNHLHIHAKFQEDVTHSRWEKLK